MLLFEFLWIYDITLTRLQHISHVPFIQNRQLALTVDVKKTLEEIWLKSLCNSYLAIFAYLTITPMSNDRTGVLPAQMASNAESVPFVDVIMNEWLVAYAMASHFLSDMAS